MDSDLPLEFIVEEGGRLDRAIAAALKNSENPPTRTQIQKAIESGSVRVSGRVVTRSGSDIAPGTSVSMVLPRATGSSLTPIDLPLEVIFEDADLLVINKPENLTVHPGAGNKTWTLAHAVMKHMEGSTAPRGGIVHRLDKDTTGAIVVAKNERAHLSLQKQFSSREASRTYIALALTTPRRNRLLDGADEGAISAPIGRHPQFRTKMAVIESGRAATTRWKIQERFPYASVVELNLESGRTHQIRVHLDSVHAPVIGDKTYGDFSALPKDLREAARFFGRQALHAVKLALVHPTTNVRMTFDARIPDDMKALIDQFRKRQAG